MVPSLLQLLFLSNPISKSTSSFHLSGHIPEPYSLHCISVIVYHNDLGESIPHSFIGYIIVPIFHRQESELLRCISRGLGQPGLGVGRK